MMRESRNQYFLKIARLVSTRTTCPRRSVGCVIINRYGHIKAESGKNLDSCMATHAEQNALLQCNNTMRIDTIFLTTAPCITCAKLIGNTSCKTVIYSEKYADRSGIEMLNKLGIQTRYEGINDREESK